jgi:hypothetical protein
MDIERLKNIGGNEWQKGDHHRIYFNNLEKWFDQASNDTWTLNNKKVTRKQYVQKVTAKFFYNVITGKWNWRTDELTEDEVDILIKNIKASLEVEEIEDAEQAKIDDLRKIAEKTGESQILSTIAIPAGNDLLESDTMITYVNPDGSITEKTYRDW